LLITAESFELDEGNSMKVGHKETESVIIHTARSAVIIALLFVFGSLIVLSTFFCNDPHKHPNAVAGQRSSSTIKLMNANGKPAPPVEELWKAPAERSIPAGEAGQLIRYGKDLIAHTSKYFGPNGSIAAISNGMNCQNCHLEGGRKLFGNNYSVFYSSYPKFGIRSGKIDQPANRIADCFERSLNGKVPNSNGKEVQAMLAYLKWIGAGVKKKQKVYGTSVEKLKFLDRAADPERGLIVYNSRCKSCHAADGSGLLGPDKTAYVYPPLWGPHSYNDGAGMYRISTFAGFVKDNMPFGASYEHPVLSVEEAWDVAAFVNSKPRPHWDSKKDFPDLSRKPIDAPFGPYADHYSEKQHKYGPFAPIAALRKSFRP
jgi:thiosulfate dehydrogenase